MVDERHLVNSLRVDVALGYSCMYGRLGMAKSLIELAQTYGVEEDLLHLVEKLRELAVPDKDASHEELEQFVVKLWEMAIEERQLKVFELNREQAEKLADFLRGVDLFMQCLKSAAVKDRDAILSRLLAPPA